MLRRIHVHNYRSLVGFEWSPPAACVLVGENGAGKSALFQVLALLQDVVVHGKDIEESGFPSTLTQWLDDPAQVIEIEIERGETFVYQLEARVGDAPRRGRARAEIVERLFSDGKLRYLARDGSVELFGEAPGNGGRIPFDRGRSFLAALEPTGDNRRLITFRDALAAAWLIKPDPLRLALTASDEASWLERDLLNFASWYRHKVQEDFEGATQLRNDLVRVIPGFSQLRLESISAEAKDLRVRFDFSGKTHEIGWAKLSEGQRLLIALYGVLRFGLEHASLIALDEIENYVAPAEIQPWLQAVADMAAEGGRQLMVISHHPESIDYLAADGAWRMWRDPATGASKIAKLEPDREVGETAYDLVRQRSEDA